MSKMVLYAYQLRKAYGEREIVFVDELKVYWGDRVGIVGVNGAGKSTLLGLLAGRLQPDEGRLELYSDVSYIAQENDGPMNPNPKLSKEFMVSGLSGERISGGELTRLKIASGFDDGAGILFADEPTANLDLDGVNLLEKKLAAFKGALLLVSHDRELLDHLCGMIIEVENGGIKIYRGNYSAYMQQRKALSERQRFEYEQNLKERKRLEKAIAERQDNARRVRKTPKRMGNSEARLHKRSSTEIQEKLTRAAKAIEARLERLEVKERPSAVPRVRITMPSVEEPVSKTVVKGEDINLCFGDHLIFKGAGFEITRGRKTALVGPNGSGKTTLANLIVRGAPGIRTAPGTRIGYFQQDLTLDLRPTDTVLESAVKESVQPQTLVRTVLARLLFKGSDVYKRVSMLSGGEKVKLSLARILLSNANLVILDEPTNYLDVYSMEALEQVLEDYEGTLLIVSHDRRFLDKVADRVLLIEDFAIKTFEGRLEEYYKGLTQPGCRQESHLDETMLKLRLAEIAGRISACREQEERLRLEMEYQSVLDKMTAMRK